MQRSQISEGRERRSSRFVILLCIYTLFTGLIDADTDVEEEQLFSALRCN